MASEAEHWLTTRFSLWLLKYFIWVYIANISQATPTNGKLQAIRASCCLLEWAFSKWPLNWCLSVSSTSGRQQWSQKTRKSLPGFHYKPGRASWSFQAAGLRGNCSQVPNMFFFKNMFICAVICETLRYRKTALKEAILTTVISIHTQHCVSCDL